MSDYWTNGRKIRTESDGSYWSKNKRGETVKPTKCPVCESNHKHFETRNGSLMWGDGEIYCRVCGSFIRYRDAG